jgi:hypothetical protein
MINQFYILLQGNATEKAGSFTLSHGPAPAIRLPEQSQRPVEQIAPKSLTLTTIINTF